MVTIALATPPPCFRYEFAALTIASTFLSVISFFTIRSILFWNIFYKLKINHFVNPSSEYCPLDSDFFSNFSIFNIIKTAIALAIAI